MERMKEHLIDREIADQERTIIRPPLLGTLCVLTIAGSVVLILAQGWAYLRYKDPLQDTNLDSLMVIMNVVCNIFTLTGAVMMWKMKRTGFFIYLAAELIPMIPPLWLASRSDIYRSIVLSELFIAGFSIRIVFIILYCIFYRKMVAGTGNGNYVVRMD
jgi:hypothetical protein